MKDITTKTTIELLSRYGSLEKIRLSTSANNVAKLKSLLSGPSSTIIDVVDSEFLIHRSLMRSGKEYEGAIFSYAQCIRIYENDANKVGNDYYHSFVIVS